MMRKHGLVYVFLTLVILICVVAFTPNGGRTRMVIDQSEFSYIALDSADASWERRTALSDEINRMTDRIITNVGSSLTLELENNRKDSIVENMVREVTVKAREVADDSIRRSTRVYKYRCTDVTVPGGEVVREYYRIFYYIVKDDTWVLDRIEEEEIYN